MVNLTAGSSIIKNVKAVIFDKDGTLMDLYCYWSHMVDYRVEFARKKLNFGSSQKEKVMYAMGVDLARKKLRSCGPVGLKKREVVLQAMADALAQEGFPAMQELCRQAFIEADTISQGRLSEIIRPIKGMHELISALHKKGVIIAIATTDKTRRAVLAAEFLGIADKVKMIVGEDMVSNYKPHPEMIELILDKVSVGKENAVMVGDAISDIEMGVNAGVAAIGVCSGLTPREELSAKTNFIVEDISGIGVI